MIKGFLIDIDDTLVRQNNEAEFVRRNGFFDVLSEGAVELTGFDINEARKIISNIKDNTKWWSWTHFTDALNLGDGIFWDYAYEQEKKYMVPTEPDLQENLRRLKDKGISLYITSNNPQIGIRHKLRLAGVAPENINDIFTEIYGATELESMKWETVFWQKAINKTGISPKELAVIGDNINDDYHVPFKVGIQKTFLVDPKNRMAGERSETLLPVNGINEVAAMELNANCCLSEI